MALTMHQEADSDMGISLPIDLCLSGPFAAGNGQSELDPMLHGVGKPDDVLLGHFQESRLAAVHAPVQTRC